MYTSVIIFLASLTAGQASTPTMLTDYWQAQTQAAKENRPLAVFLGTGQNGFQNVSRDGKLTPEIQKVLSKNYTCVYLDLSQANAKKLAKALEITRGKGLVISDRTGKSQAFHHDGDLTPADLARQLERHTGIQQPTGDGNGGANLATGKYVTLTAANFKAEVTDSKQIVIIDFWAEWCGPCKSMEPAIAGLAADFAGRAKVGKVNIDNHRSLAQQYGINAIPAFVIIQDGQVVDRIVGATSKANLAAKVNARLQGK